MKKAIIVILEALFLSGLVTGCAAKETQQEAVVGGETISTVMETEVTQTVMSTETVEETEIETEMSLSNAPSALSDDLYDFQVSINGVIHQFPMWYADFEAMGWTYNGDNTQMISPDQYTSSEYWVKDGYEVGVSFANLFANSVAYADSMIGEIKLHEQFLRGSDWEIILPGNIQWGISSLEDIKAAYGEPSIEYEGKQYYELTYVLDSYREVELSVKKDTNVLGIIRITNMVELEDTNNSVDSAAPEAALNYQAPASLGDDFYSYNVELEGNLYTLPCPVSEFLANGFEIDAEKTDVELASGDIGSVRLNYNGKFFESTMINFADYATTTENCFVTSVATYDINNLDFALVTPGGIKLGSTEDELLKAIEGFHYTEKEKSTGVTYYSVFPSDDKISNDYEFGVENGVVTSIVVKNIDMP